MPRKAKPATANPSRSDLTTPGNNPRPQGVKVPTSLPYGEGQQLSNAQRAIPLPTQPGPAVAPVSQPSGGGGSPSPPAPAAQAGPPPGNPMAALGAAGAMAFPSHLQIDQPTNRPTEPIQAGLPTGPGPGPEALGLPASGDTSLSETLTKIAQASGSRDIASLAQRAQAVGQ